MIRNIILFGFIIIWVYTPNVLITYFKTIYNRVLKSYSKHISIAALSVVLLTLASSCSVKGYKSVSHSDIKIANIKIFDDNFKKAIYKTDIAIYNNNLTGITIIKKLDSAIRVVSISEMGMKYFDFEFPDNQQAEPIVHYIMKPLDKKLLINMIKKDFGLLFYIPRINDSQVMINMTNEFETLTKHNKLLYFSDSTGIISQIKKRRIILPNKTIITLSKNNQTYPGKIYINHGRILFNFVVLK